MPRINPDKLQLLDKLAVGVTVIVLFVIGLMRRVKIETSIDFSFLPPFHATLNTMAAVCLILGLIAIKKGNKVRHEKLMLTALSLSGLFLLSYVVYHFTNVETKYCYEGFQRTVYLTLLASHIILAGGVLPFMLFALNRALTGHFEKHKRMVRWVYPLWLYVTITGPVCYLMLSPCY